MPPKRDQQQLADLEAAEKAAAATTDPDVASTKASLRGFKSAFTRVVNRAMKQVAYAGPTEKRTARHATHLMTTGTKLDDQYGKIEEAIQFLMEIDDDHFDDYENDMQVLEDQLQATQEAISDCLNTFDAAVFTPPLAPARSTRPSAPTPTAPRPSGGTKPGKPTESLRPKALTEHDTPWAMREWSKAFQAYYESGAMDQCSLTAQQVFFSNCLEGNLPARMAQHLTPTTPVLGKDGCVELLEQEFLRMKPILARRVEWLALLQGKMSWPDFRALCWSLGQEADLGALTPDDLTIIKYVQGTSDEKLREKFLKEKNPSLDDLNAIAEAHEAAKTTMRTLEDQKEWGYRAYAVSADDGGQNKKEEVTRSSLEGKCWRCGVDATEHKAPDCPKKYIQCFKCGTVGHVSAVCMGGRRSTDTSPARPRTRSPSPSRSPDRRNIARAVFGHESRPRCRTPVPPPGSKETPLWIGQLVYYRTDNGDGWCDKGTIKEVDAGGRYTIADSDIPHLWVYRTRDEIKTIS